MTWHVLWFNNLYIFLIAQKALQNVPGSQGSSLFQGDLWNRLKRRKVPFYRDRTRYPSGWSGYMVPRSCSEPIGGLVSRSNDSLAPLSFDRSIALVPAVPVHVTVPQAVEKKRPDASVSKGRKRNLSGVFRTREFVGHCGCKSRVCFCVEVVCCSCFE